MKIFPTRRVQAFVLLCASLSLILLAGSANSASAPSTFVAASNGPPDQGPLFPRKDGNPVRGRAVFRYETFGNEVFWTDAARLPAGMVAAGVTPLAALGLGLQIDVDKLDSATKSALTAQLHADPSGRTSALLNDPKVLLALIDANAVVGLPIKDSNHDGKMDVAHGDKVGATCALCHTRTDGSVFTMPNGGSIGHRLDGLGANFLAVGKIFALAANSRALYPILQLSLTANGGKTIGRAPTGLTENSTEADVDAYLSNEKYYPRGMFDDTFDGNGDPMHNSALFRQDLSAPYGTDGTIARLDNFGNLVYTGLLDPTTLTTKGGRAFLHLLAGAAGDEVADDYVKVLAATGVTGYPYVQAKLQGKPGQETNPLGVRVDNTELLDMNAYLVSLQAPHGANVNPAMAASGREVFRTEGCTNCHNVDQGRRVPSFIVPMKKIFPGDNPVLIAMRTPPLNPILNTVDSIFDDKMAVVNASIRGDIRGTALPLLLDLARKPNFLHDDSVSTLELLLDPVRGSKAPHPFYVSGSHRADLVAFLKSLDTNSH